MPQSGAERPDPPICVHYCDPKATHNPSPQPNSVHKRPKLAQRAPILPSVYTIAATRGRPRHNSVHKRPNQARRGPIRPFVYTPAVPCSPRKPTGILVEHVFKLEDLVIVEAPSQMVTINGVGATADVTLGNNFSALRLANMCRCSRTALSVPRDDKSGGPEDVCKTRLLWYKLLERSRL